MTQNKQAGFADVAVLIVVAVCFAVGGFFALKSDTIDSPPEQAAEAVLKTQGIEVDFSSKKKTNIKVDTNDGKTQVQIETDNNRPD